MLSFEDKLKIIESFTELERKNVSLGRVNFHYNDSIFEKKIVVQHLHPNGNGFVYVGHMPNYEADAKGFINIREFSEADLRRIVKESIQSLSENSSLARENAIIGEGQEERWVNDKGQTLLLVLEDDWWNIYAGLNLEEAFGSYDEAEDYLFEEGFKLQ